MFNKTQGQTGGYAAAAKLWGPANVHATDSSLVGTKVDIGR